MNPYAGRYLWVAVVLLCACADALAQCEDAIRLNQVGFYMMGAKRAVVVTQDAEPRSWRLVDADGERLLRGRTRVFGSDAASGQHLHVVDFGAFDGRGDGFRIRSGCAASHPFTVDPAPFGRLKYDALSYFYHNRSGARIEARYAGGEAWARPVAHRRDRATCRTGTDNRGNDWPGCDYRLDASGGWYDAADHGKYVVTGAVSAWTLINLHEYQQAFDKPDPFADGRHRIPEAGNRVSDLLDEARYELEFLLRMQAPAGAAARVPVDVDRPAEGLTFTRIDASGMVHHKIADERWTPLPTPPHRDREARVLYQVSTSATLGLAAVGAQCARVWRSIDTRFADRCLAAAERAYAAAERNPSVYFVADFPGSGMYSDRNISDEFFWAATELFITTGEPAYAEAMRASSHFDARLRTEPSWSRVAPLAVVSLALAQSGLDADERDAFRGRIVQAAERFQDERNESGYGIPYATLDYPWGSNSNLLNRAIVLGLAYEFTGETPYVAAVIDVMDYLLGRNPLDRSYIAGYGDRPMRYPHHRFWAASLDDTLPPPPPGALSGGPNSRNPADEVARALLEANCAPQTCWRDDVQAFSLNEVAINWNAPLVWVATFLDAAMSGR